MQTHEIHAVPELHGIPILKHSDPQLSELLSPDRIYQVAEACDTRRLHHLLHRHEYRPLFAVEECDARPCKNIRVYFARLEDIPGESLIRPW